ncbi:hypothetical protein CL633_00830 [bacterium]|nr:hypothetical protein [bacterium]|tara:strand:+ start:7210 stop:7566 length:357 start_codon:yes stop_codon:yes gene_type:complete
MINFKKVFKSFKYSFKGLKKAFYSEQNLRIQSVTAVVILITGFYIRLSKIELSILVLTMTMVIGLELINTTAEKIIDLIHPKHNIKAEFIKDVMAASVLIAAIGSIITGLIIFLPHFI